MRNRITVYDPDIDNNQEIRTFTEKKETQFDSSDNDSVAEIMASEGKEDFYNYLKGLGLAKDRNLIFLSSMHHYYYDADEMKKVRTVINLKQLNHIKQIKNFLHSVHHILPSNCNFIGCFVDFKRLNGSAETNNGSSNGTKPDSEDLENGVASNHPFINMLYNIIDLKTNKILTVKSVSGMLENHGFKVLDMKSINGLTYFHAQKINSEGN
jgi:hypothetical protein